VRIAIAEAERRTGDVRLAEQPTDPATGQIRPIKLITDNGPAFKAATFAVFLASRPGLTRIRTRWRSPSHNGVRERRSGR
jgi:transposase InsO family protein